MTNQEKLEELKKFLQENGLKYFEQYRSHTFNVTMDLKVRKLRIAVFISDGDPQHENALVYATKQNGRYWLTKVYNPFFIRESDSMEFIIEKMQNTIIKRMMQAQKRWQKEQRRKDSPCNNCPPDRRCDECNVGLYIKIK